MTLREEEGLASRVNSVQLVLDTPYPCMDECRPRLSPIWKENTADLVAADHLTNILMFQINTEPQLESPLSTLAPVRYKHLSKLTVAIAAPGVIVIYVTEVN